MPFQVSPGVNVSEIDLTTVVPAVSTTEGAIAGHFMWGPVDQRVLIDSEDRLVNVYNKPTSDNHTDFFVAANFLAYGNALYVNRVAGTGALNAVSDGSGVLVKNEDHFNEEVTLTQKFAAKYAGALGNSLKVSICDGANAWENTVTVDYAVTQYTKTVTLATDATASFAVGDLILLGTDKETCKIAAIDDSDPFVLTLEENYQGATVSSGDIATITRRWEYFNTFDNAPGTSDFADLKGASADEMHIVVVDEDGAITGTKDSVIDAYSSVSKAKNGKTAQGGGNYYRDVINQSSAWLWVGAKLETNWDADATASLAFTTNDLPTSYSFTAGANGSVPTASQRIAGYDVFRSAEDVDISFVLGNPGTASTSDPWTDEDALYTDLITNLAGSRKDCITVISPPRSAVVNNNTYSGAARDDVIAFRDSLPSSSYAVIDSGWKYQYDKYNDVYRYVPLNADTAGLMVQTDTTRDPWYSPAGFNRGNVKNAVRLAWNPTKGDRDQLYKKGINPVVTFPGQGTVLFGDKTMLAKPSAFDRINVRRLFIVLEKAISTASKFTLFEFNDEFTRSQFRNLVEPFLRDVQGRRGITDFRVVCDSTNNTGEVIDRNEFVGDIYIKPARSINFIQLNFVAVRTGVEFSEVVGQFG